MGGWGGGGGSVLQTTQMRYYCTYVLDRGGAVLLQPYIERGACSRSRGTIWIYTPGWSLAICRPKFDARRWLPSGWCLEVKASSNAFCPFSFFSFFRGGPRYLFCEVCVLSNSHLGCSIAKRHGKRPGGERARDRLHFELPGGRSWIVPSRACPYIIIIIIIITTADMQPK